MNNFTLVKKYQQLEKDFTVEEIRQVGSASLVFCGDSNNAYWNWALLKERPSVEMLEQIEQAFNARNKKYSLVIEDQQMKSFGQDLIDDGFKIIDQQDWMILEKAGTPPDLAKIDFLVVKSEKEIDLFVETFNRAFTVDDEANPFGNPGEVYAKVLKRGLTTLDRVKGLVIFGAEKQPVAVSMLVSYNGTGYLSNIGVIPAFRGQGFGKVATQVALAKSQEVGNNLHALKILKDFGLDTFYAKFGFKLFSGNIFLSKF